MATNLRTENQPFSSVEPTRILAGLYRSTFVDILQERFRLMLGGAYGVYVAALGEGFEPALRAHLTDVLQDIVARTAELADVFEEELMCSFRMAMEGGESKGGSGHRIDRFDSSQPEEIDPGVQDFVAKTIRGIETRHGSIVLALTKAYVKLMDKSVEDFRPPWTATNLFSAFAVVLDRVEIPIHERVKLALYRMFAQEVLRHLGDACLAFRDVLPLELEQLDRPKPESQIATEGGMPVAYLPIARDYLAQDGSGQILVSPRMGARDQGCRAADIQAGSAKQQPNAPVIRTRVRMALFLLGGMGLVGGIGWMGKHFFDTRGASKSIPAGKGSIETAAPSGASMPQGSPAPSRRAPASPLPLAVRDQPAVPGPTASLPPTLDKVEAEPPEGRPTPPAESQPASISDPRQKREILKLLKLSNFAWRVDPGDGRMLFDLTIGNTGKARLAEIEVVCSQYSTALDFLEAAKTVLEESVEPGQNKSFKAIPIGFSSRRTERVNCVIADAVPER